MKAKYILLMAVMAGMFCSCEKQAPFDAQSPNDTPLILKPYSESVTGSFVYSLKDENTPLVDSVVVTPSKYSTVNWYVDNILVNTGTTINMCFSQGTHDLLIEVVTSAGKRTTRSGLILVNPHVLWAGPRDIEWDDKACKVSKADMASIPVGSRIIVFFELKDGDDSFLMRITTPSWGDKDSMADNLVPQKDMKNVSSPFIFEYDARCKALVDNRGAMSIVGQGLKMQQIICDH